jgi:nucleotide-binding universal stress UspA family protein
MMSESTVLLVIAVVWVAIGIALSLVMGRRGYDAWGWLIVGAVLGPLAIVLALTTRPDPSAPTRAISTGHSVGDHVDVLVGVDGSPQSEAALRGVAALFGDRLGRLAVATVVPHDATGETERAANALVARVPDGVGAKIERIVLRGRPPTALREQAAVGEYDVIAIGRVGHGLSKALLGSTASRMAHATERPVLLFGERTSRAEGPARSGLAPVVLEA